MFCKTISVVGLTGDKRGAADRAVRNVVSESLRDPRNVCSNEVNEVPPASLIVIMKD